MERNNVEVCNICPFSRKSRWLVVLLKVSLRVLLLLLLIEVSKRAFPRKNRKIQMKIETDCQDLIKCGTINPSALVWVSVARRLKTSHYHRVTQFDSSDRNIYHHRVMRRKFEVLACCNAKLHSGSGRLTANKVTQVDDSQDANSLNKLWNLADKCAESFELYNLKDSHRYGDKILRHAWEFGKLWRASRKDWY